MYVPMNALVPESCFRAVVTARATGNVLTDFTHCVSKVQKQKTKGLAASGEHLLAESARRAEPETIGFSALRQSDPASRGIGAVTGSAVTALFSAAQGAFTDRPLVHLVWLQAALAAAGQAENERKCTLRSSLIS